MQSPPTLTEAQWQDQVIQLARTYGWRVAHFRPAQTSKGYRTPVQADGAGFPDLVLVRQYELIFAELKTDTGSTSADQRLWLCDLADVEGYLEGAIGGTPTVRVYVWRPRDFDDVAKILNGVRSPAVASFKGAAGE